MELSAERSRPAERTRIGIYRHGYDKTVLDAAGAVDAGVDAVRSPGRQNGDGVGVTAPVRVAAAYAHHPPLRMGREMI